MPRFIVLLNWCFASMTLGYAYGRYMGDTLYVTWDLGGGGCAYESGENLNVATFTLVGNEWGGQNLDYDGFTNITF